MWVAIDFRRRIWVAVLKGSRTTDVQSETILDEFREISAFTHDRQNRFIDLFDPSDNVINIRVVIVLVTLSNQKTTGRYRHFSIENKTRFRSCHVSLL